MTERRLGDRYELGAVLGYGGMAEVHRGRDVRLGRDVAVKTLRVDLARDPTFQSRFRREAQSAAALNHPAVVAVYDTGEDHLDGVSVPYIVMEYVDGRTLRDILQTERAIMPNRALEITADVLRALDYSHRSGIVHRDIKPGNVMLTRNGDVKVMDFGIARAVAESSATVTQTAAVIGTAQYLSPEQARGEKVDPRSDIYSTGCLLYELLTGNPPFTGDSPVAVAYQHVREDPVPPSRLNADVSPAVDAIVLKSMAKNPANRYQTAAEMREDIERALAGRPVEATPVLLDPTVHIPAVGAEAAGPDEWERRRRGRGWVYALLTIAVIAVLVGVGFLVNALLTSTSSTSVRVPKVIGMPKAEAIQTLKELDLKADPQNQASSSPVGQVTGQSPTAGQSLAKNHAVTIFVSSGPGPVTVPSNLVGMSYSDASNLLTQLNLKAAKGKEQDSDKPEGTVLQSSPAPGASASQGEKVTMVVASGKNTVPNVVGYSTYDSAAQAISAAGFTPNNVPTTVPGAAPGTVVNTDPLQGTSQPLGSVIKVLVAAAPPSPSPEPSIEPSTKPSTKPSTGPPSAPPPSSAPTGSGGGDHGGGAGKGGGGSGSRGG